MRSEREVREHYLRLVVGGGKEVRSYSSYSITSTDGLYLLITQDRFLVVIKPFSRRPARVGIFGRLRELILPVPIFRPRIMSGGITFPLILGGEELKDHRIEGWDIRVFKGSFRLRDERGEWIEGECVGLIGREKSWDALGVDEALRKMIKLIKERY